MDSALAHEVEQTLRTLATPVEDGQPVKAAIGVVADDKGHHRHRAYWGRDGMRQREYFGPLFFSPRDAIRFVDQVNARVGIRAGAVL
jgi:hypothetical protein